MRQTDGRALPEKVGFTISILAKATCPPGKQRILIYDTKSPGLALDVTANGSKSFIFYRRVNGSPLKMKLGGFPEIGIEQARKLAAGVHNEAARGIDPREARRSVWKSITLQELFDAYCAKHADLRSTERTRVSDKSRFDTCFADWTAHKLATIRPAHVRDKHSDLARTRGKVTANRAVQLLRRMFNWARIEPNPAAKGVVDFFPETQRERFIQADELPRFFEALDASPNETVRDYVKMSLWTGARRANVQSMRWDEISIAGAIWTIPAGKAKGGAEMKIHLSPAALAILQERKGNGSDYVFPGRGKNGHLEEPKKAWAKILAAAKIKDLHLHDLRRTLGSWQAAGGTSLAIIGKSLGHKNQNTTAIYARLNLDSVCESVNTAGAAIIAAAMVGKPPAEPEPDDNSRQGSD